MVHISALEAVLSLAFLAHVQNIAMLAFSCDMFSEHVKLLARYHDLEVGT